MRCLTLFAAIGAWLLPGAILAAAPADAHRSASGAIAGDAAPGIIQPAGWRDWDDQREARWKRFYHRRMHWHLEREGDDWATRPAYVQRRIIEHEWQDAETSWRE